MVAAAAEQEIQRRSHSALQRAMSQLESWFERLLWASRFVVLIAVASSLVLSFAMFYVASADVVHTIGPLLHYADPGQQELRAQIVSNVVETVDGYLLASILLIFAFGLYELFISRIGPAAEGRDLSARVLIIRSLDDLKDRLAKVVLLILAVKFFQHAQRMSFSTPMDLVQLSIGVLLIAAALYLSHRQSHSEPE
jgi:uncharacterized membrane protein YqhA